MALYGAHWHLWKSKVAKIALVGARIHLQKDQRDVFTRCPDEIVCKASFRRPNHRENLISFRGLPLPNHTNLIMLARGLLKWKMARKHTYKDDTCQV